MQIQMISYKANNGFYNADRAPIEETLDFKTDKSAKYMEVDIKILKSY